MAEQGICEVCDGVGQIRNHPVYVRTAASYGVTCTACNGTGMNNSINASERLENDFSQVNYGKIRPLWQRMQLLHRSYITNMPLTANNAPASGINPTHEAETRIS